MDEPRPAKAAKTGTATLQSSIPNMSNMAFRHVLRFVPAYTLAVDECVTPQMGRAARAAVVELTAKRFGITVEPVPGCAWRMLVQDTLSQIKARSGSWLTPAKLENIAPMSKV